MISISPEQRCTCRHVHGSGRFYFGRESCVACSLFIVRSDAELRVLRELEQKQLEREKALSRPKGEPGQELVDIPSEVRRMFPTLSGWEGQP